MKPFLVETLSNDQAKMITESDQDGKNLYMKGIFIQGGVENGNNRIYPVNEISNAVDSINEQIKNGYTVLGECDHPDNLRINLDRVTHMITEMKMDGPNGMGKLKILPTPMGNIIKTMTDAGVKLGVSSRGSGDVDERTGHVRGFEMITVDIVATPSAPKAFPIPMYEGLMNMNGGYRTYQLSEDVLNDPRAQRYLREEVTKFIKELKIR